MLGSPRDLERLLEGDWVVIIRNGFGGDVQNMELRRHQLRGSTFKAKSPNSGLHIDGKWHALNNQQIVVRGRMLQPGYLAQPFQTVFCFEVHDDDWLSVTLPGSFMEWRRD